MAREEMQRLTFDLAEKNNLNHPFNREKRMAGRDWFKGFMRRHSGIISIRTHESTSLSRVIGFRKSEVQRFYDNLGKILEEHHFNGTMIFNVDETGREYISQV